MEITTKFDYGQTVWLINDNKIVKEKVEYIRAHVIGDADGLRTEIKYDLGYENLPFGDSIYNIENVEENRLFATLDELIQDIQVSHSNL